MINIEDLEHWHFEITEEACNYLLDLVLKGQKKATSSALAGYRLSEGDIPAAGDMSVITDWEGNPRCVIKTTEVRIIPYKDINFDLARLEGEDETLESWQNTHERFFRAEGRELGYEFSEEMKVVFEKFEVVEIISSL